MDSETSATVSTADVNFLQDLQDTLRHDIVKGHDYGGLVTKISRRLERFRDEIATAAALKESRPWSRMVWTVTPDGPEDGSSRIQITGPFLDEGAMFVAKSSQEASDAVRYVSALGTVCTKLEDIRKRSLAIVEKSDELELEQMGLAQPAETTVDEHIRLLRQYNKTKDVGQQLIGMIAESRGVPVGDVYREGDYGVSADD